MKDTVYRTAVRLLLPHLAQSMALDAGARMFAAGSTDHVLIENHGRDRTIFSFAGGALLYAGVPAFEFRKMLSQAGRGAYNLVFFRDVSRLSYHVKPDGSPGGLAFYESEIRRISDELGSRHNVAIGGSAGAAAAFYFGTRCGFKRIIAFNVPFPLKHWNSARAQCANYLNLWRLVRHPAEYAENALLSLVTVVIEGQMRRVAGPTGVWEPLETYCASPERPAATLFYGRRCRPDARNAERVKHLPELRLVPLPVGLHNCATYLKRRGTLAATIQRELDA